MAFAVQKYFLGRNMFKASLCILPRDHFLPERYPVGDIRIILKNDKERLNGSRNLSGFYTFVNIPNGNYSVGIETVYYHDKEFDVLLQRDGSPPGGAVTTGSGDLEILNYNNVLVVTATLRPKPNYPFPSGTSLIRGTVFDAAREALPNAAVRVVGKDVNDVSTNKGEFALSFSKLTQNDVHIVNASADPNFGKRFVRGSDPNNPREITVEAEHPDLGTSPQFTLELEEGRTAFVEILY